MSQIPSDIRMRGSYAHFHSRPYDLYFFATLDNVVTLGHAGGSMDIGQWPRLILAVSGLVSGVLFDYGKRQI